MTLTNKTLPLMPSVWFLDQPAKEMVKGVHMGMDHLLGTRHGPAGNFVAC